MTFYQTSGKSVKALSMDDVFGVGFESNLNSTSSDSSPRALYTLVPFVRRAVRLRMNAIASVPVTLQKADTDLSTRPEWQGLMKSLPTALAKVEMALCLSPYGAYWRKNTNKLGLNPTPEWLLPQSVWPYITADEGLRYFRYVHPWGTERAGIVENLTPDQVVAFWYPSLDRASWPGSPPGVTAQPAGTALNAQDVFIASYFRRGAIKAVLLQVPPDAKPADRDRLTAWWRSIVGGVSNAWKSVVVQTNVTPVVIGDGLKEMNNESLTRQYRQDVAAAFDIPETMLMQGAANYATAKIDRIGFYEETIFPEHQMILGCINQQWLQPAYGAELVAHPEQTEARQDAQLSQAQALTELVGQPILTVDEGRAWIGFEPMAESAKPVDDSAEFDQMAQEASQVDQSESEHELTTMGAAGKTAQIMGYHIEAGVVSRNEARAGLGLAPEDESSDQHLRKLQIALSVAKAAIEAGYSPADAQRLVGLPEGMSATPTPNELKRYAHDLPTGMYIQLPGSDSRKAERSSLLQSHSATRKAVQDRHSLERKQVRDTHAQARQTATDARERLKATNRRAAEMQMLAQRQTAERTMLASLHTAERSRLTDRHAAQRSHEVATLRGQGAVKSIRADLDDEDDYAWKQWDDIEDAFDEPTGLKFFVGGQPRGPDGRFVSLGGTANRRADRQGLRDTHAQARTSLRQAHATERASGATPELRQKHAAERQALRDTHASERAQLGAQHATQRESEVIETRRPNSERGRTGTRSMAYGTDPNVSYELQHRLVDMSQIQASNTANGGINPHYDPALQPRDRSRQASQVQIDTVARRLNPDVLVTDFHQIDKGTPIIDAKGNVLSGNGRTLALQRAADVHPAVYAAYKEKLKEQARSLGIDPAEIDKMQNPVIVRELKSDHDPAAFAREANSSGTLRMSPMEQAKVDAGLITDKHMMTFHVEESQGIDQALRDRNNRHWVNRFLEDVPENERANLLTRNGELNQLGLYRAKAAIYTRAFPGEHGERMAESMLESLDPDLKSVQTGISAALPALARVRAQTRSGVRDPELDLTPDIARAVDVLARIRDNPSLTANTPSHLLVKKYLEQSQLFDRELDADQERILVHIDSISRKPTAVRDFLNRYSELVHSQPEPGQGSLFGDDERLTRSGLLDALLNESSRAPANAQEGMF